MAKRKNNTVGRSRISKEKTHGVYFYRNQHGGIGHDFSVPGEDFIPPKNEIGWFGINEATYDSISDLRTKEILNYFERRDFAVKDMLSVMESAQDSE